MENVHPELPVIELPRDEHAVYKYNGEVASPFDFSVIQVSQASSSLLL